MKLKGILINLFAGTSVLITSNIATPAIAGACDNAPRAGDEFIPMGLVEYRIRSTVYLPLTSNNERKVAFAFKKLELEAQKKLAEFLKSKVKSYDDLDKSAKAEIITGANGEDTTEEMLIEAEEIISGISASAEELLRGSQELGRCHEPGEMVILTRGINSETQKMISNPKSNAIDNDNSSIKAYRKDTKGYSGYGNNLDDF